MQQAQKHSNDAASKVCGSSPRNRGVALMLVMIAVAMAVILSLSFVTVQSTSTGVGQNVQRQSVARSIAESALVMAVDYVKTDQDWRTDQVNGEWVVNNSLYGGTFTITAQDGADIDGDGVVDGDGDLTDDLTDPVTLTVVGSFQGVTHTVYVSLYPSVTQLKANVAVDRYVTLDNGEMDSFDSREGPYGGPNVSAEAVVSTNGTAADMMQLNTSSSIDGHALVGPGGDPSVVINFPGKVHGSVGTLVEEVNMPTILEPNDLGPSVGDRVYGAGMYTISSDLHVDNFQADDGAVIQIDGDVTILVQGVFQLANTADLELQPGASLQLYLNGGMQIDGDFNANTGDPGRVQVFSLAAADLVLDNSCEVVASIFAPQAALLIQNNSQLMGTFIGKDLTVQSGSKFHVDVNPDVGKYEPEDPLIAHWTLDDASGGVAVDSAGDSDGTLTNGPTWDTGEIDGGLRLDGTDDYIRVPSSPALNISSDMTFTGWFKLDSNFNALTPTTQIIMSKMIDNESDMTIALIGLDYNRAIGKGSLLFKVEHGPDTEHFRYVFTNKTDWEGGRWYHFVAILDSKNHANNSMAVDGVDDTSVLVGVPDSVQIDLSYDADLYIGGKDADTAQLTGERFFQGIIDDVRIYNRKLTADQIANLYNTGDAGFGTTMTTFTAKWIETP